MDVVDELVGPQQSGKGVDSCLAESVALDSVDGRDVDFRERLVFGHCLEQDLESVARNVVAGD